MLPRATEDAVAGHIWPAGRYLPTPGLSVNPSLTTTDTNVDRGPFVSMKYIQLSGFEISCILFKHPRAYAKGGLGLNIPF